MSRPAGHRLPEACARPRQEIANVEKLVGTSGLRSFPWDRSHHRQVARPCSTSAQGWASGTSVRLRRPPLAGHGYWAAGLAWPSPPVPRHTKDDEVSEREHRLGIRPARGDRNGLYGSMSQRRAAVRAQPGRRPRFSLKSRD
jgi:hypothetical protein